MRIGRRTSAGHRGSGLGLAIVRQAAEAHGGYARAANAEGGGALMEVSFGPALELAAEDGPPAATAEGVVGAEPLR